MLVLHPNTNTIVSLPTPPPFAVSSPETVNDEPGVGVDGVAEAVSMVETGFDNAPDLRVSRTVPGPLNVAIVGSLDPEHVNPTEQVQLETV
jgi:hypothetical protein